MRYLALLFFAAMLASRVCAQEVEVLSIRFNNVHAPGGGNGTWLEADVTLNAHPAASASGQMISRVKVTLLLAFELPAVVGGERRLEHYRAEAECVALEAGRAEVRFYLPPELVKRDQLHGDPKYWAVDVTVGGRPMTLTRNSYSPALTAADSRKNFQTKGAAAAAANDGLLQPQYLTPFANEYPRATPSFVRREGP